MKVDSVDFRLRMWRMELPFSEMGETVEQGVFVFFFFSLSKDGGDEGKEIRTQFWTY